jgi:hypothetical protein
MGRGRDREAQSAVALPPDRVKHLEFLQTTIARQASHSFSVKGWSLTVAAVLYAYTAAHLTWWAAVVALLPPVVFAGLDAFYLRQERLFRALYDASAKPSSAVPLFSMDTRSFATATCRYWPKGGVLRSNSWRYFHATVVLVGIVLLGIAVAQLPGVQALAHSVCKAF